MDRPRPLSQKVRRIRVKLPDQQPVVRLPPSTSSSQIPAISRGNDPKDRLQMQQGGPSEGPEYSSNFSYPSPVPSEVARPEIGFLNEPDTFTHRGRTTCPNADPILLPPEPSNVAEINSYSPRQPSPLRLSDSISQHEDKGSVQKAAESLAHAVKDKDGDIIMEDTNSHHTVIPKRSHLSKPFNASAEGQTNPLTKLPKLALKIFAPSATTIKTQGSKDKMIQPHQVRSDVEKCLSSEDSHNKAIRAFAQPDSPITTSTKVDSIIDGYMGRAIALQSAGQKASSKNTTESASIVVPQNKQGTGGAHNLRKSAKKTPIKASKSLFYPFFFSRSHQDLRSRRQTSNETSTDEATNRSALEKGSHITTKEQEATPKIHKDGKVPENALPHLCEETISKSEREAVKQHFMDASKHLDGLLQNRAWAQAQQALLAMEPEVKNERDMSGQMTESTVPKRKTPGKQPCDEAGSGELSYDERFDQATKRLAETKLQVMKERVKPMRETGPNQTEDTETRKTCTMDNQDIEPKACTENGEVQCLSEWAERFAKELEARMEELSRRKTELEASIKRWGRDLSAVKASQSKELDCAKAMEAAGTTASPYFQPWSVLEVLMVGNEDEVQAPQVKEEDSDNSAATVPITSTKAIRSPPTEATEEESPDTEWTEIGEEDEDAVEDWELVYQGKA